jgi:hypothetical protein
MDKRNDGRRGGAAGVIESHGVRTGRWPGNGELVNHTVYPVKYFVGVGDLSTGYKFYGPFKEDRLAEQWAHLNVKSGRAYRVYPMFDVREDA